MGPCESVGFADKGRGTTVIDRRYNGSMGDAEERGGRRGWNALTPALSRWAREGVVWTSGLI